MILIYLFSNADAVDGNQRNVVQMLSVGRLLMVDVGSKSAELDCDFRGENFSLFDNPVQWYKVQLNETAPINLMGNLMEPFATDRRFRVSLTRSHPRYNLQLTIFGTGTTILCNTLIMLYVQFRAMMHQNTSVASAIIINACSVAKKIVFLFASIYRIILTLVPAVLACTAMQRVASAS
jgi:hypothetical protein